MSGVAILVVLGVLVAVVVRREKLPDGDVIDLTKALERLYREGIPGYHRPR